MSAPSAKRVGLNLLWLVPGVVGGSEEYTTGLLRALAHSAPPDLRFTLFVNDLFGRTYPDVVDAYDTVAGPVSGSSKPLRVLAETTWFGIIQAGSFLGAAVITWLASRSAALERPRVVVRLLVVMTAVMMAATLTFALASTFWLALIAFWAARWVRISVEPLVVTLVNRGLASDVRATVLSMVGQAEALGEVCGGPALGLVGTLRTVRVALVGAALVLLSAFPLLGRTLSRRVRRPNDRVP